NIPLLLNSAYALKGEECWIGICSARNLRGSDSTDFGEGMVLDVLPATLAEFVALEWSAGQVRFMDADGDGLLSLEHGGVDPDDSTWDTDGDTLSDAYELSLRNQPS